MQCGDRVGKLRVAGEKGKDFPDFFCFFLSLIFSEAGDLVC